MGGIAGLLYSKLVSKKNSPLRFPFARYLICLTTILAVVFCFSGCSDGDDGKQGPQGPKGESGLSAKSVTESEELKAAFTSAEVADDGTLVVDFTLADENGAPVVDLASNQLRFSVAKLNPAGTLGAGESSSWQSYINRLEKAPTDPAKGSGAEDKIQATTEANGTLNNNDDGSYRYTFATNLKSVTLPIAVNYAADDTHRVAIQISGSGIPVANATYDWQPDNGSTTNLVTRNIVATETCNSCHGQIALHGSGRTETGYCVTCHNPGSADANSGNSVDFAPLIHKIHRGANLPSVNAGGEYAIWGFRDSKHDYSDVHFPKDVRQCSSCHSNSNPATPDGNNWIMFPTVESCGSCHDDVNFTTGENHIAGARTNAECSTCHVGNESNLLRVDRSHEIGGMEKVRELFAVRVDETKLDPTNNDVQLLFSIINPADNSVYTQAVSDMDFVGRARIYRNPVDLSTGYVDSFNFFDITTLTPNAGGQYQLDTDLTLDSNQLLAFSTRFRVCTNPKEGELLNCDDEKAENVGALPTWGNVNADGNLLSASEELAMGAAYENCASCHGDPTIGVHGGDYSSLQQCRACHNNSFLRDVGNLDLKFIIHAYHAGNLDDGNGGKEPMHYPDNIANCSQCHSEGQLDLPVAANKWAAETTEGLFTSSTAFICSACHLSTQPGDVDPANIGALPEADQVVVGHMLQNGAIFNGSQAAANITESCAVCHSNGSLAAIDSAHQQD
jgi:OmcA/MtrC family decaheme c-type cytochrome